MIYFICIFVIIFIYFLIFNTPFFLINYLFGLSNMNPFYLNYKIYKNNNIYKKEIKINHIYYDGRLASMKIKDSGIKVNTHDKISNDFELYHSHNILTNLLQISKNHNADFSSFNYNVSNLLKFISLNNEKILKVCVIVSTRGNNDYSYGNLINVAFFNVHKFMDINTIMKRFKYSVNKSKKNTRRFLNIYEILKLLDCDIILNSWKDLSYIESKNGIILKRFEPTILSKQDLLNNLLDKKKLKVIFFDKYNNDWVINKIKHINILSLFKIIDDV